MGHFELRGRGGGRGQDRIWKIQYAHILRLFIFRRDARVLMGGGGGGRTGVAVIKTCPSR
jgi:hypothetical protein